MHSNSSCNHFLSDLPVQHLACSPSTECACQAEVAAMVLNASHEDADWTKITFHAYHNLGAPHTCNDDRRKAAWAAAKECSALADRPYQRYFNMIAGACEGTPSSPAQYRLSTAMSRHLVASIYLLANNFLCTKCWSTIALNMCATQWLSCLLRLERVKRIYMWLSYPKPTRVL